MIRVGRCTYDQTGKLTYPKYDGFTAIIVVMKSHSKYYPLSPYYLKNNKGYIMENIWQFSKIYKTIPESTQHYSRYDQTIIWSYPKEKHIHNGEVLPAYWNWRKKGMKNKYAIRYPAGFKNKSTCEYAILDKDSDEKLDYIDARKKIYIPMYCDLVKADPTYFPELKTRLDNGENLLIIEPDGPHQESLDYYKTKWSVLDDFIEDSTVLVTDQNMTILAHDVKHPFGHGYCLAMALLDMDTDMLEFWDSVA